jgi:WD40 repeat protein/nucleoside phosphorylase/uncharacterized protein YjbI with pentapeptide repeats
MNTSTILSPDQARRQLSELHTELGTQSANQLAKLIDQLDRESFDCSVADAHQVIAPDANLATANKALDRLLTNLNSSADAAHKTIRMEIHGAKRLGVARRLRFIGQVVVQVRAETNELQATRKLLGDKGEIEQYAVALPAQQRVLIISVNENETYAVYAVFGKPLNQSQEFDRLPDVGNYQIYHQTVSAGSDGLLLGATPLIDTLSPSLVVAVGIAFGCQPQKQQLGQVLIATQVQDYELQRIGKDKITARGPRESASEKWLQVLKRVDARHQSDDQWPQLKFGLILSGNKLIDNAAERDRLVKQFDDEAIGGDMETAALAKLCKAKLCHWLMIKSIADFADGNKPKDEEKIRIQRAAATAAAKVLRSAFANEAKLPNKPTSRAALPQAMTEDFQGSRAQLIEHRAARLQLDAFNAETKHRQNDAHPALAMLVQWLKADAPKRYFAILGEYGMGKTVLCQRLNCLLMEWRAKGEAWPMPLYFDLRRVTGLKNGRMLTTEEVVSECINRGWQSALGEAKPTLAQVAEWIEKGALIIFDGLDEVLVHLTEADGQQFVDQLLRLLPHHNSTTRMLLSCRSHFFRSLREQHSVLTERGRSDRDASQFESMLLLPFNDQQIREYLSKALPGSDPDKLLETLRAVHNLEELAARPVLLKNVVRVMPKIEGWRAEGRKVYGVTLYREFVLDWLERDKAKHHLKREHKIMLARDLAAALWRRGQRLIPIIELENWFADWRAQLAPSIAQQLAGLDRDKLEEDLRNSHFLVREDGGDEANSGFRFAHSSIQEFFLAEYLFVALQNNQPERWAFDSVSEETLDFLGQLLAEASDSSSLLAIMSTWCKQYRAKSSELIFAFAVLATEKRWPAPSLVGSDFRGATLHGLRVGAEESWQGMDMSQARFDNADLRSARFYRCNFFNSAFDGALLDWSEFHWCALEDASFARIGSPLAAQFRYCSPKPLPLALSQSNDIYILTDDASPSLATKTRVNGVTKMTAKLATRQDLRFGTSCLNFSVDGRRLLTGGDDGTLLLWEMPTGQQIASYGGHKGDIIDCRISSDHKKSISVDSSGMLIIRQLSTDTIERTLQLPPIQIGKFVSDETLVSIANDGTVAKHSFGEDISTTELYKSVSPIRVLSISAALGLMAVRDEVGIRIWDLQRNALRVEFLEPDSEHGGVCTFCLGGTAIAYELASGDIVLRDIASGTASQLLIAAQDHLWTELVCSPDGERLLALSVHPVLVDLKSKTTQAFDRPFTGFYRSAIFSPTAELILLSKSDEGLVIVDGVTRQAIKQVHPGPIIENNFCMSDDFLYFTDFENRVLEWRGDPDAQVTPKLVKQLSVDADLEAFDRKTGVLFTSNHSTLARVDDRGSIEELVKTSGGEFLVFDLSFDRSSIAYVDALTLFHLDIASRKLSQFEQDSKQFPTLIQFTLDHRYVISAGANFDGTSIQTGLRVFDCEAKKEVRSGSFGEFGIARSLAETPNSKTLLLGTSSGALIFVDRESLRTVKVVEHYSIDPLTAQIGIGIYCAISSNGRMAIAGGADGQLIAYNAENFEPQTHWQGHNAPIRKIKFSDDNQWLITSGYDGTIRFWNTTTWECERIIFDHASGIAAWNPQTNEVYCAYGEAWRYLKWQVIDKQGDLHTLPFESFGDHCQPLSAIPGIIPELTTPPTNP